MIIAAAQTKPVTHNTDANIQDHLRLIESAAQQKVQLIIFPEMSLTGYEIERVQEFSFSENDERLNVFKEKAVLHHMHIVVGASINVGSELHIGSFIFSPDGSVSVYTKQFLHDGEEIAFSPNFNYNPLLQIENQKNVCGNLRRHHPSCASGQCC